MGNGFDWSPYLGGYTPSGLLRDAGTAVLIFAPIIFVRSVMRVMSEVFDLLRQAFR